MIISLANSIPLHRSARLWMAFRSRPRIPECASLTPAPKKLIAARALALLPVPAVLGSGAQRHPLWRYSDLRVPTGLVRAAEFVRTHGESQDLADDAGLDAFYVFRALSERRA
jgi:hypothetical protein